MDFAGKRSALQMYRASLYRAGSITISILFRPNKPVAYQSNRAISLERYLHVSFQNYKSRSFNWICAWKSSKTSRIFLLGLLQYSYRSCWKIKQSNFTVGIQIPDFFSIQMVYKCPKVKCSFNQTIIQIENIQIPNSNLSAIWMGPLFLTLKRAMFHFNVQPK